MGIKTLRRSQGRYIIYYYMDGSDPDKERVLRYLSESDFHTVLAVPTPEDVRKNHQGRVWYGLLNRLGIEVIFKDVFLMIRKSLPEGLEVPDEKLFLRHASV